MASKSTVVDVTVMAASSVAGWLSWSACASRAALGIGRDTHFRPEGRGSFHPSARAEPRVYADGRIVVADGAGGVHERATCGSAPEPLPALRRRGRRRRHRRGGPGPKPVDVDIPIDSPGTGGRARGR